MSEENPQIAKAKAKALRLLASRPRTVAQIRDRLAREGLSEASGEVIGWLTRLGYLDDAAFARARVSSLLGQAHLGPRLAERRLLAAGVDAELAKSAVAAFLANPASEEPASPAGAERDLCRIALQRRLRGATVESLEAKDKRRLARFLLGRGFSSQAVAQALGIYFDVEC